MQVSVERTGPCQAKVSFQVPHEEFEGELRRLLGDAGRNLRVKGFRPGHAPAHVVEKLYGKEARQEAKQRFVQKALQQAVEQEKLRPLAQPRVELSDADVLAGADFSQDFDLDLRPEFELGNYVGVEIDGALQPVSDEEVEAAIEQVAKNNARPEPAGDEGLPEDGMALSKVEFLFGDKVVFLRDGLRLSPTAPMPGIEPEEVKRSLTGAKAGQTIEMPALFPDDFEVEEARGQPGLCRVTVNQAFRIVLPTREELIAGLKLADEADLLVKVRERLEEANREMEDRRVEGELVQRLIDQHPMELPETVVVDQVSARLENLRKELEEQGLPASDVEAQVASQADGARVAAERAARGYFLIEGIAQKEGLLVTDEEMGRELRGIAERNRTSFEDVRNYYREKNLLPQLAMEIVERKVRNFLREKAVVTAPRGKA